MALWPVCEEIMSLNLKSIILMIIGMGCLTLCDLLIKIASQTLPLGQVMIIFGVGSIMHDYYEIEYWAYKVELK